jgi:hypothetical protein
MVSCCAELMYAFAGSSKNDDAGVQSDSLVPANHLCWIVNPIVDYDTLSVPSSSVDLGYVESKEEGNMDGRMGKHGN